MPGFNFKARILSRAVFSPPLITSPDSTGSLQSSGWGGGFVEFYGRRKRLRLYPKEATEARWLQLLILPEQTTVFPLLKGSHSYGLQNRCLRRGPQSLITQEPAGQAGKCCQLASWLAQMLNLIPARCFPNNHLSKLSRSAPNHTTYVRVAQINWSVFCASPLASLEN